MFYVLRSGCAWRMLPDSFPPWSTVFSRFRRWRLDGTETTRAWRLEVVRHPDRQLVRYGLSDRPARAFRVLPRRGVVERTFAWLGQSRRLSTDYERLPATREAMGSAAMTRLMLRRLTRPLT